ncbi:MAG: glycosyltransferase family 2 protein [Gemmatimonadaceae bacterium]|nr:glycosyltransferase family 2 protein [Gemmatimonadaceae bacterium]
MAHAVRALAQAPPAIDASAPPTTSQLVSVIIPIHNGTRFLPDAIASIVAQGHPATEIILVDDGSTEDVVAAADALPVQVRLVHQHNMGPAAARNLGIRAASAEILAFLDVDDLWPSGKLSTCLAWLAAHPELDVVMGRAQLFQHGSDGTRRPVGNPAEAFPDYIGAGVYRRRAFQKTGLFDPMLRFGEDIDWFRRAEHKGAVVDRIDVVTLDVRRHEQNMTKDREYKDLRPLRLLKNAIDQRRSIANARTPPLD